MEELGEVKQEAPKRKPGRPAKIREAVADDGAPVEIVEKEPTAKRGRKPKKQAIDESVLARQLIGAHLIAAQVTRMPELAIDQEEADLLAKGISGIAQEYGVALSGKAAAWMGLLGACAMVYGPRAVTVYQKLPKKGAKPKAQEPVPFGPLPVRPEPNAPTVN